MIDDTDNTPLIEEEEEEVSVRPTRTQRRPVSNLAERRPSAPEMAAYTEELIASERQADLESEAEAERERADLEANGMAGAWALLNPGTKTFSPKTEEELIEDEKKSGSWNKLWPAAFKSESGLMGVVRMFTDPKEDNLPRDPTWNLATRPEEYREETGFNARPRAAQIELNSAQSEQEYLAKVAYQNESMEIAAIFEEAGPVQSTVARLVGAILDPAGWALGFASLGAGSFLKLSRIGTIAFTGISTSLESMLLEKLITKDDVMRSPHYMIAGGAGLILGSSMSTFLTRTPKKALTSDTIAARELDDAHPINVTEELDANLSQLHRDATSEAVSAAGASKGARATGETPIESVATPGPDGTTINVRSHKEVARQLKEQPTASQLELQYTRVDRGILAKVQAKVAKLRQRLEVVKASDVVKAAKVGGSKQNDYLVAQRAALVLKLEKAQAAEADKLFGSTPKKIRNISVRIRDLDRVIDADIARVKKDPTSSLDSKGAAALRAKLAEVTEEEGIVLARMKASADDAKAVWKQNQDTTVRPELPVVTRGAARPMAPDAPTAPIAALDAPTAPAAAALDAPGAPKKAPVTLDDVSTGAAAPHELNGADLMSWGRANARDHRDVSWQYDLAASMHRSFNEVLSSVGGLLLRNPSGRSNFTGSPQASTVVEETERLIQKVTGVRSRDVEPHYRSWLDDSTGKSWSDLQAHNSFNKRAEFDDLVYRAYQDPNSPVPHHKDVVAAIDVERAFYKDLADLAEDAGVAGWTKAERALHPTSYLPRKVDQGKIVAAVDARGEAAVISDVRAALLSPNQKRAIPLTNRQAKTAARLWVRAHTAPELGYRNPRAAEAQAVEIRRVLTESTNSTGSVARTSQEVLETKEMIDEIANMLVDPGAATISPGKWRLEMDIARQTVGEDGVARSVMDLLDTRVSNLANRYAHQIAGPISLAKSPLRIRSPADWVKMRVKAQSLDKEYMKMYGRGVNPKLDADYKNLEVTRRMLYGESVHDLGPTATAAIRSAKNISLANVGGSFWSSALTESSNVVGAVGVRTVIKALPALKLFGGRGVDNTYSSPLSRWFDNTGIGNTYFQTGPSARTSGEIDALNPGLNSFENKTQVMAGVVTEYSMLAPLTRNLARFAAEVLVSDIVSVANGARRAMSVKRMWDIGLDPKMHNRALTEIRKHAVYSRKMGVDMLEDAHMEKWDPAVSDAMDRAAYIFADTNIQKNSFGDAPAWLIKNPWMSLMTQFKTFQMASWAKMTLRGMNHKDKIAASQLLYGMFFQTLRHVTKTMAKSVGRRDHEEYLEKHLAPSQIALQALLRVPHASHLGTAVDATGLVVGSIFPEAAFSISGNQRNVGGNLFSAPTVSYAQKSGDVLESFGDIATGDVTQETLKNLTAMIPMRNFFLMDGAIRLLQETLPPK